MMVTKRSPEKHSEDIIPSKKLKVNDDNGAKENEAGIERIKSKKKNESILINPGSCTYFNYILGNDSLVK